MPLITRSRSTGRSRRTAVAISISHNPFFFFFRRLCLWSLGWTRRSGGGGGYGGRQDLRLRRRRRRRRRIRIRWLSARLGIRIMGFVIFISISVVTTLKPTTHQRVENASTSAIRLWVVRCRVVGRSVELRDVLKISSRRRRVRFSWRDGELSFRSGGECETMCATTGRGWESGRGDDIATQQLQKRGGSRASGTGTGTRRHRLFPDLVTTPGRWWWCLEWASAMHKMTNPGGSGSGIQVNGHYGDKSIGTKHDRSRRCNQ